MVKVKICGITNLEDAKASINAGCDALGFVFFKLSPRYIAPQEARQIIKKLPKAAIKVGVFVNEKEKTIKNIAKLCNLDILQFHGDEPPGFCQRFNGYKIIKAFKVKGPIDLKQVQKYKTFGYLFDTFVKSKIGGTGKKFDWRLVRHIRKLKQPIFLSGGITVKNVRAALKIVNPHWLDISSSVERRPGEKDHKKVKKFIGIVKAK